MDDELKQELKDIKGRLDSYEGILNDYHTLLTNHMTDYSTKFGRLRASLEASIEKGKERDTASIENGKIRDKALQDKIDSYKWGLILVASFTVISLGGFVILATWALSKLIGG